MKKFQFPVFLLLLVIGAFMMYGCGGSKKTVKPDQGQASDTTGDYDEIEKLLGISRDEGNQQAAKTEKTETKNKKDTSNDDLIKLLEVDEGKKKDMTTGDTGVVQDKRLGRLQNQVNDLQKEIQKKDMVIADLKAQLMTKDEELAQKPAVGSKTGFYRESAKSGAQVSSGQIPSGEYRSKYEEGISEFNDKQYNQALQTFEQLLASDLNNDLSDNAQYWVGECFFALGKYHEAVMAFEKVFTFRNSNKNDYAQFKIGQCYYLLKDYQRARQEFQQFLDNYPKSSLDQRAREYLAKM